MNRRVFAVVLATVLFAVPAGHSLRADAPVYSVEDLGTTIDGFVPTVTGVNAAGQVSGYVDRLDGTFAVRYTNGVGWTYLPGLDLAFSVANGINAQGDLTGYHVTAAGTTRAFRYLAATGVVEDLDLLPDGSIMTVGVAINAAGDVAGYGDAAGVFRAFRAVAGFPPVVLPTLGGASGSACGINETGQVVGTADTASGIQHAVRINMDLGIVDAGSFDGPTGASYACAIDADGVIGGNAAGSGGYHAFTFDGVTLTKLDDVFATKSSNVEAMAAGTSVGWFTLADRTSHAFVHTTVDGSTDLNSRLPAGSGWVLSRALGVNAGGQIVGDGLLNGVVHVYRLTPATPKDTTPPVFTSLTATPSSIFPPKGQNVTVTVTATATDDSGVAPVCTLDHITSPGAPSSDFAVTGANSATVRAVAGRVYTLHEVCVDGATNAAWSSVDVTVLRDTTPPVITSVTATPSRVWPPNETMVPVTVAVSATDDVDDVPSCGLSSITGTGVTAADYAITGPLSAKVRATGGRTYTLHVTCADAAGNRSEASVDVVVPPDVTAPVITSLTATPSRIWPPTGKMADVVVSVTATDDVDASPTCTLTSVTGAPAADVLITGPLTVRLRAATNDNHEGAHEARGSDDDIRIYVLHVTCSDRARNKVSGAVNVTVASAAAIATVPKVVIVAKKEDGKKEDGKKIKK
jgi:uncharacterized membrane protein